MLAAFASVMEGSSVPVGAMDSITLGQLKSMVDSQPKAKQSFYDFRYEDEDTFSNELEEFYSYVEVSQVAENYRAWQGSFPQEWTKCDLSERIAHVQLLLESLEHRDAEIRFTTARRLFYILQGSFGETTSSEHQLHWIIENCKVVRAANGTGIIVEAIKFASSKLDLLSNLSDLDMAHLNMTTIDKQEFMEEVCTELSVYLGMLYHLLEVFKSDHDFAEELMSLDPPLPIYFINLLGSLKERSARGYPMKKLLLVLWKTLLTTCGGIRELTRCKKVTRELCGLPSAGDSGGIAVKSSPSDFITFRQETAVKYPTFSPIPGSEQPASILAEAYSPIPVRPHYHHHNHSQGYESLTNGLYGPSRPPLNSAPGPLPPTPIPTPPPPFPKPKKQQYQTDQNRPFIFPFSSRSHLRNAKLVPFAIDEADRLYERHMHIGAALWQMAKTREECILDESGLENWPNRSEFGPDSASFPSGFQDRRYSVVSTVGANEEGDIFADIAQINEKIVQAEAALKKVQTADRVEFRRLRERREDLVRLKRVEAIYSATLSSMQGYVLVLLKLLLASVHATTTQPPPSATSNNGFPAVIGQEQPVPPAPPPTLEELDVMRHREITSKAVSAILMLTLQWFKVSHAMKFHHFGQLLLDSNCLLLILKMFGLQEVSTTVITRTDSPEHNFFRYCYVNFAKNVRAGRPEDTMLNPPPRQSSIRQIVMPNGQMVEEDVELLTNYSWRNFFTSINFVRIMQKLSKHRSHRIWLLVQYKSSAILKRMLKVSHQMLQIHVLKLLKSQVPYCGRKWRQSNMKVITSIYLNCRPDLRDEWLTGSEVDDVQGALAQETALRTLIRFYNTKRYGSVGVHNQNQSLHRRTSSHSVPPLEGLPPGPELAHLQRSASGGPSIDPDVFPPVRSQARDPAIFLPYIPEDIAFEDEYEEYLHDLGISDDHTGLSGSPSSQGLSAWQRLSMFTPADIGVDGISDSESIAPIGELGPEQRLDDGQGGRDENVNDWEHMSPKTMAALPKSPAGTRRSSSGSGLRPVLPPFGLDDGSAVDDDEEEEQEMGPMPREQSGPFAGGRGVDEVEFLYNE